jgi:hypothetical protein
MPELFGIDAVELALWVITVVFVAGLHVMKIRVLEARLGDIEGGLRDQIEKSHEGRAELWKAWSEGPPAVLAHLESIEKNQSRQERRIEAMAAAFAGLQTTIIERLTTR